jgi:ribonucleoside-diphosphate reductase alpha chain
MQAALQRHVDSSISKTINCPEDISFEAFQSIYLDAFDLGLKGCTVYRPNAVTGAILSSEPRDAPAATSAKPQRNEIVAPAGPGEGQQSDVVYLSKPLDRDAALAGYTYKIKWPESDHAIYVTINDIERKGRRRPFEIFINTRNLEHYAWTVALTRMISAVFRRGGDVSFVAEELKAVFDPQGGRWMGGRYVPSVIAAIGEVIETHMRRIGFLADPDGLAELPLATPIAVTHGEPNPEPREPNAIGSNFEAHRPLGRSCPRCAAQAFVKEEGCWTCRACGFSRCD